MRSIGILVAALAAAPPAAGQESHPHIIESEDLGLRYAGPFGWEVERAEGSGAWTTLATYRKPEYDAEVLLQVRNNVLGSYEAFKRAIAEEFKESPADAKAEPGKTLYKLVETRSVKMKKGAELPGLEVAATVTRVDKGGKKREHRIFVRTFYGKNRLFRIRGRVRRVRYKKVKNDFEQALIGLRVHEGQEEVTVGTPLSSRSGAYSCLVPEGYTVNLSRRTSYDVSFTKRGSGITLQIYSYRFDGDLRDHIDQMLDYYDDEFILADEEPRVLGERGFTGTITRGRNPAYVIGTVKRGRAVRIHAIYEKDKEAAARKLTERLLKTMRTG